MKCTLRGLTMMTFTVHIINFSHIKYLPIDPLWLITIPQPRSKLQYLNCINYVIHIRLHYSFDFGNNVKTISRDCVVRCFAQQPTNRAVCWYWDWCQVSIMQAHSKYVPGCGILSSTLAPSPPLTITQHELARILKMHTSSCHIFW